MASTAASSRRAASGFQRAAGSLHPPAQSQLLVVVSLFLSRSPFPVPVPCSLPFYAYLLLPLCRRRRRRRLPVEAGDPAAALFDVEVVVLVSVAGGDDVEVAVEAVLAAPGVADWRRKRTGE